MSFHPRWIGAARHSGRVSFEPIFEKLGGVECFASASEKELVAAGLPHSVLKASCWVDEGVNQGDTVLFLGDPSYPTLLLDLEKPPPVLWARGNTNLLGQSMLSVVGARACTPYGKSVAGQLGQMEGAAGGVLVSGAARGIDACAHRGAMESGRTIAVLGAGLDASSGLARKRLMEEILHCGGLILSEFPRRDHPVVGLFRRGTGSSQPCLGRPLLWKQPVVLGHESRRVSLATWGGRSSLSRGELTHRPPWAAMN